MAKQNSTPQEIKLLLDKQQRRAVLRAEYLKQTSNPFRHATGEGGAVVDTAALRFQAMRVNRYEHFKPNLYTTRVLLSIIVIPYILHTWWIKSDRDAREHEYRTGQVAYRDRRFKFV